MRINKYLALHTSLSRRAADDAVRAGQVVVNGTSAELGTDVMPGDTVTLAGQPVRERSGGAHTILLLNKPVGYVCSRRGQGSRTIYELLPDEYRRLKPAGRLDKDSSGLLVLTDDGQLAHELTHPKFQKEKTYEVVLDKPLAKGHEMSIALEGIALHDGISRFHLEPIGGGGKTWRVIMHEGRNRQIRRTFAALGYMVVELHRTQFGIYGIRQLADKPYIILTK